MRVSRRVSELNEGGDDGWGLYNRARALVEAGVDVAELTIGEHDVRTDARILQAMADAASAGNTGYASIPGQDALRDAIAARTERITGVPTTRDNIAVTPGGQAGLFAAHMAVCDAGDHAMMVDPYYATYPGTIRSTGATPVMVAARPEDGFQLRASDVAAVAGRAKSLLINTPNNPTGVIYTHETLAAIASEVSARDMWLISDEVYDCQIWQGKHLSPRALPGMAERTLVIGSLSKSHAMTGSRLGWIIGPPDVIAMIHDLSTATTYGVAGFIQDAGTYALSLGAEFEAEVGAPFQRRRDLMLGKLAAQQVLSAVPPDGAMYVMVDVLGTGLTGADFADRLLDEERIAVMPGASFGDAALGHIRVALTLPDDRFADAIDRMIAFAHKLASS